VSSELRINSEPTGSNDLWLAEQETLVGGKKVRPESKFLTRVKKSFEVVGAFFYKIPDLPHYKGQKTRFDIEKPFDAFAMWAGVGMAIEGKYLRDYEAFGLRNVRYCQEQGLNKYAAAGGKSFVFLGIKDRLLIFDWEEMGKEFRFTKKQLMQIPYLEWSAKAKVYPGLAVWRRKIKIKEK
jgi:hypothetical protein